jgi:hypothetical protein
VELGRWSLANDETYRVKHGPSGLSVSLNPDGVPVIVSEYADVEIVLPKANTGGTTRGTWYRHEQPAPDSQGGRLYSASTTAPPPTPFEQMSPGRRRFELRKRELETRTAIEGFSLGGSKSREEEDEEQESRAPKRRG